MKLEIIKNRIFILRGCRVILSSDLAELYRVAPKVLVQAVKRNRYRFPADFMFQLNEQEFQNLKSQIVTSSWGGLRRALPYAFTEQGVAMLSSVLNSKRAIRTNIQIMRTFVEIKQALGMQKELNGKMAELEKHIKKHDQDIDIIFEAIRRLINSPEKPKRRIGFHAGMK